MLSPESNSSDYSLKRRNKGSHDQSMQKRLETHNMDGEFTAMSILQFHLLHAKDSIVVNGFAICQNYKKKHTAYQLTD